MLKENTTYQILMYAQFNKMCAPRQNLWYYYDCHFILTYNCDRSHLLGNVPLVYKKNV